MAFLFVRQPFIDSNELRRLFVRDDDSMLHCRPSCAVDLDDVGFHVLSFLHHA